MFVASSAPQVAGCEKDTASFQDPFPSLVEVYVNQGLPSDSSIAESKEAVEGTRVIVKIMDSLSSS